MKAYVIYQGDIVDSVRFQAYKELVDANIVSAGGRYVVASGDIQHLEGPAPASRTVIVEFP